MSNIQYGTLTFDKAQIVEILKRDGYRGEALAREAYRRGVFSIAADGLDWEAIGVDLSQRASRVVSRGQGAAG